MFISTKPFPREQHPAPQPVLIDNLFAPEIFVSGIAGFALLADALHLTLDTARYDHSQPSPVLERVVVGRLVLPIGSAQALVTTLNAFLEQHGLSPSKAAAAGGTFQ